MKERITPIYVQIDMEATGERIKVLAKEKGVSANDLASANSISPQAVHKWMRGDSIPSHESLYVLCKVLGVNSNEIIIIREV